MSHQPDEAYLPGAVPDPLVPTPRQWPGSALASVPRRLVAAGVDCLVLIVVGAGVALLALPEAWLVSASTDHLAWYVAGVALGGVYEVGMTAWRGQTVGKMATGIRIVPAQPAAGTGLDVRRAATRWAAWQAPVLLPGLWALASVAEHAIALVDRRTRTGHDLLAGTLVVRVGTTPLEPGE